MIQIILQFSWDYFIVRIVCGSALWFWLTIISQKIHWKSWSDQWRLETRMSKAPRNITPSLPSRVPSWLFGSVDSLCHLLLLVISKWVVTVDVLSSFPFELELLQGQFAWKQELISFLLPCSFLTWRLSPCLRHHSSALKKWTLRTWMHLSKPRVRKVRQPLVPVFHMCGWPFRNIQYLFMKISFES